MRSRSGMAPNLARLTFYAIEAFCCTSNFLDNSPTEMKQQF